MKRIFFRTLILGMIVALGLLAMAHAQRPGRAPYDDAVNPLRGDSEPPEAGVTRPNDRENGGRSAAPLPPDGNPLRGGRVTADRDVRPAAGIEPPGRPPQIRLLSTGHSGPGGGSPAGPMRAAGGDPQLMPPPTDRLAIPSKADENREPLRPTARPEAGVPPTAGPQMTPPDPRTTYQPGSIRDGVPDDAAPIGVSSGTGQPGGKQLEGPQSPQVVLQKIAPPEIQVGRPAVLRIVVRNMGAVMANDVEIHDQVPRGTRLLGTAPQATQGPGGALAWSLGALKPGGEATVEMQVMPTDEGEVGSVATVRFQTAATARSIVTRPKLVIQTAGANRVLVGDETTLTFTVSNPGSGIATGVVLGERIPAGLKHPGGAELEYTVGDLKPGESRQLQLRMKAVQAGAIANVISARADANLRAEHRFDLEVVSPKLEITMNGPKRRYLEREATYQLSVSNPGTAPAQQVELVAYLPPGLKFVNANNAGRYDQATRAVYWRLDELPVNQRGTVELVTLPVEPGQFNIKVRGAAQRGLLTEKEQPVVVEGLAAVIFQLSHTKDPVEVGGETTYEISVVNQGSKASANLQLSVFLPPELKPLAAEGPTRYTMEDHKVVFETIPQLAPKSVAAFRVRAQGVRAGDLRVRCQLMTDEMQRPVVKEESTRVYADE